MATCANCGVFFSNKYQLGPHRRICKVVRAESEEENFDSQYGASDVDIDDVVVEQQTNLVDEPVIVSLHSLTQRPLPPWGIKTDVAIGTIQRKNKNDELLVRDYREVTG